jgi:hypothetical protein
VELKVELKVELETRQCTNKGCSRTFRVLSSSKQTTCSNSCTMGPFDQAPMGKRSSKAAATEEKPSTVEASDDDPAELT